MSVRHLERLLEPRSVAVIGASDRPGSVGATVWRNVAAGAFAGPRYAVNRRRDAALPGTTVYRSVDDLPLAPDLAVICTPPPTVAGLVEALGRRGTRAAVVMTAGLDAAQKQATLLAARPSLLRVLGPNCIGLLGPATGLNASFAPADALSGEVAFVTQSGALLTAVLDWASSRGIGFSRLISLGESLDVDAGDVLDYLAGDAKTRSILLYLESIAATPKFMSAARGAARGKPVIVVKAGRAGRGVAAAASHTGALAGSDIVVDAAIRRAGLLRVDTFEQLFAAVQTLARFGTGDDEPLTIVTNGGGAGVMAADAAARLGVPLREPSAATLAALDACLPANWSRGNPIDIVGDAPIPRYTQALQAVLAEPGPVLFMHAPTAIVASADIARACTPLVAAARRRVLACWLGDRSVAEARRIFAGAGVADFATPEEAIGAVAMLATYRRNQALLLETPAASGNARPDVDAARRLVASALADGRSSLDEVEAKALLRAYGIPTVESWRTALSADAAVAAAVRLGYPVALKIDSPDISHKSDAGGVALGLRDESELRAAVQRMTARLTECRPAARLAGFTVQAMVVRPTAQELIVGASVDPSFGPVVLFGHGGTAVETIADRAVALPPLNRVLARDLVERTRVAALLAGYRDRPPARVDAVCDVLIAVAQMVADVPELAELDINPLLADADGVIALDARVRLDPARPAGAARFAIAPYPTQLVETIEWRGETLVVRPVRPEDEPQHRAFVARLRPDDLRLRFFNARRSFSHEELARLTQIDYAREMAFIVVRETADGPQTLAVARTVTDPDNVEAEFAIVVRPDAQAHGLGRLLLAKTIAYQASHGTRRLIADVLAENRPMRALATASGFTAEAAPFGDRTAIRYVLALQPASREAMPASEPVAST